MLQYIYELFDGQRVEVIPFEDIYAYLQRKLQVSAVNRHYLRELLNVYINDVELKKLDAAWVKYIGAKNV